MECVAYLVMGYVDRFPLKKVLLCRETIKVFNGTRYTICGSREANTRIESHERAIEWAHPRPHVPLTPKPGGGEGLGAERLEIDENVNRVRLIRHFLTLNLCLEQ